MLIRIGNFDYTEVWNGVFYKKLSDYPNITDWEIRTLLEFMAYEKRQGRTCSLEFDDGHILSVIRQAMNRPSDFLHTPRPAKITECTACPVRKGCETRFVCHTTSPENAESIFRKGKLLSAVKARNLSGEQLMTEKRNAAGDPPDYFEYVMFAWGNCQAGDRLVMERKLGRFPDEEDLSVRFTPGIRFYFRYDDLTKHPGAVFDGVLPVKIRDEVILRDYVHTIVIPQNLKEVTEPFLPSDLRDRVIYVKNDCADIWEWSEKVYRLTEARENRAAFPGSTALTRF